MAETVQDLTDAYLRARRWHRERQRRKGRAVEGLMKLFPAARRPRIRPIYPHLLEAQGR